MSFNKDDYVAFTDWETGKKVYRYIDKQTGETATGKSEKGISKEYYNHFDSHNICRNPATILKHYRIAS